jgi:hypothetical protein
MRHAAALQKIPISFLLASNHNVWVGGVLPFKKRSPDKNGVASFLGPLLICDL